MDCADMEGDATVGDPSEPGSQAQVLQGTMKVESGDPLLKRLVDLAQLGFHARLTLFSNGQVIQGSLIPAQLYCSNLAGSIRSREKEAGLFGSLDEIVARAIEAEMPLDMDDDAEDTGGDEPPEPRYIHLADVTIGAQREPMAPFLRLRLPAVSGFWLEPQEGEAGEAG